MKDTSEINSNYQAESLSLVGAIALGTGVMIGAGDPDHGVFLPQNPAVRRPAGAFAFQLIFSATPMKQADKHEG